MHSLNSSKPSCINVSNSNNDNNCIQYERNTARRAIRLLVSRPQFKFKRARARRAHHVSPPPSRARVPHRHHKSTTSHRTATTTRQPPRASAVIQTHHHRGKHRHHGQAKSRARVGVQSSLAPATSPPPARARATRTLHAPPPAVYARPHHAQRPHTAPHPRYTNRRARVRVVNHATRQRLFAPITRIQILGRIAPRRRAPTHRARAHGARLVASRAHIPREYSASVARRASCARVKTSPSRGMRRWRWALINLMRAQDTRRRGGRRA